MRPILTLSLAVLLGACTGNKKQTESHDMHAKNEAVVSPEIKPFDQVDASVKAQINGFLTDYFALNQALIEDNQDGAKAAAKKLSGTISKFDMTNLAGEQMDFYHAQLPKLTQSLKGMEESSDIEETRLELALLSEGMYALVKAYHPNESALYFQFCPMAKNGEGASWVSNKSEIINPYMGQRMLKCGKTTETL